MLNLLDLDLRFFQRVLALGQLRLRLREALLRRFIGSVVVGLPLRQLGAGRFQLGFAVGKLLLTLRKLRLAVLDLPARFVQLRFLGGKGRVGLGAGSIQLGLSRIQLFLGLLELQILLELLVALKLVDQQLRRVQQRLAGQILRRAHSQPGKTLFHLPPRDEQRLVLHRKSRFFKLRQTVLDLGAVVVQLLLLRVELGVGVGFGFGQRRFALGELRLAGFQLRALFLQRLFGILQRLAILRDLRTAAVQLPLGRGQLGLGVRALRTVFRLSLVILRLRLRQRLARRVDHAVIADLCALLQRLRQRRFERIHLRGVGLGVERPVGTRRADVDLRKIVHGKRVRRRIGKSVDAAAAQRCRAALHVQVQRRGTQTNHGEFLHRKAVVYGRARDAQGLAQRVLAEAVRVEQAFVRVFRQTARRKLRHADALRQGEELDRPLRAVHLGHGIHRDRALRRLHAGKPGKIVHVLLRQAERRDQSEVKELRFLDIIPAGAQHGGLRRLQAAEEAHAQRDDGKDRQKAPQRVPQLPQVIFSPRAAHHHSISSTGVGRSFVCMDCTVPFLMWITRSAIAVSAELCVMMTTVMPFLRLCACKSARICLPVL